MRVDYRDGTGEDRDETETASSNVLENLENADPPDASPTFADQSYARNVPEKLSSRHRGWYASNGRLQRYRDLSAERN